MDDTDLAAVEVQVGTKLTPVGPTDQSAACDEPYALAALRR